MTEQFYDRKLQIQTRIPQSERLACNGGAHTDAQNPNGLTKERLIEMYREYTPVVNPYPENLRQRFSDLSLEMDKFLRYLP